MFKCMLVLLALVACDRVDLMTSPLIISDGIYPDDRELIATAVREWSVATDGRFCPGGGDCDAWDGKVETRDPWAVTEQSIVWEGLRGAKDTNGVYELFRSHGDILYDSITLIRGKWSYRTVLHELGHRMGLDHDDNYENPDSPIMGPPGGKPCLGPKDIQAFCRIWGCAGHDVSATCPF